MTTEIEPDGELIRRARAGDADAFAALCERYRRRVWRVVASVTRHASDTEDLAQETFVRAFCALSTYRAEASFEAWLCRIALNAAHDHRKSAWRKRVLFWERGVPEEGDRGDGQEAAAAPSTHAEAERREIQRRVRAAVATLGPKERAPIWLIYFEEFSLAEVSRLEGVPESTIRSRVRAGLKRLQGALEDFGMETAEEIAAVGSSNKGGHAAAVATQQQQQQQHRSFQAEVKGYTL